MRWPASACCFVWISNGIADLVESVWICLSISCMSKRTLESGVERSIEVSEELLVARTRELAKDVGEKFGSRKAS